MTREEYLQKLWQRLSGRMPRQELENVMHYYEEYFDEAGPAGEARVISELGTPAVLTARIMGERVQGAPYVRERRRWTGGQIALLICLFPIWLPLLIAGVAVIGALLVSIFAVVIAIGAAGVAAVAGGALYIWCGITAIFHSMSTAVFFAGLGCIAAGLGVLLVLACGVLFRLCCKGTGACFGAISGRNRREAMV